jgi:hypothetical protein
MTLDDLISFARRQLDDITLPYGWSDDELAGFYDEAQNEACQRAWLLQDNTSDFTRLTFAQGINSAALDSRILAVDQCLMTAPESRRMRQTTAAFIAEQSPATTGIPWYFYGEAGKILLYPTPDQSISVRATVFRLPLVPLTADNTDASPELPAQYHLPLSDWVIFRAGSKQNMDFTLSLKVDPANAVFYLKRFESTFGAKAGAKTLAAWKNSGGARKVQLFR